MFAVKRVDPRVLQTQESEVLLQDGVVAADRPLRRQHDTRPTLIYWLIDTRTNQPFYCGKTVNSAHQRRLNHKYEAAKGTRKIHARVRECGEHFRIQVMEKVPYDGDWIAREKHWIYLLRGSFPDNCNSADGGAGAPGRIVTEEQKAHLRALNIGRKHTPEAKAKVSAFLTGRKCSPETVEKRRQKMLGRKMTPEQCAAISERAKARFAGPDRERLLSVFTRKGKVTPPEVREKQSAARRGRKLTPEQCAAISLRNKGRKMPAEAVAKSAAARTGAKRTPEQRARMSAAHKGKKWNQAQHEAIPAGLRASWKRRKDGVA